MCSMHKTPHDPINETERFNYCWGGFSHMWRKSNEANTPVLAGANGYDKQVPLARAIPLWAGVSSDGFQAVLWHSKKKTDHEEWSNVVRVGKLTEAIRQLNPKRRSGPWTVLCDNETFLRHKSSMRLMLRRMSSCGECRQGRQTSTRSRCSGHGCAGSFV